MWTSLCIIPWRVKMHICIYRLTNTNDPTAQVQVQIFGTASGNWNIQQFVVKLSSFFCFFLKTFWIFAKKIINFHFFFLVQRHLVNFYMSDKILEYKISRESWRKHTSHNLHQIPNNRNKQGWRADTSWVSQLAENHLSSNSPKLRIKEG
jgi:hypothetical protein